MLDSYTNRLLKVIPGGAHTYSRGHDQYPRNAPPILQRAKGAYVFDHKKNKFLDYGMGLRSVNIGYAHEEINAAAIDQLENGNNLTRPSMIELQAAELFVDMIDSADMVKFTKNGSTAVSAAVKLSRAYTNRDLIAVCSEHPFFSYDDWFIGSTVITKGIPDNIVKQTKKFHYNDIASLEKLISEYPKEIACVVMEPSTVEHPKPSITHKGETFLHDIKRLCQKHGIVFVLDEMITGFRWHLKGAQAYYNIVPDLSTFGKAMANGFSVAAIAGRRELMSQGSIEIKNMERMFLLSTTHGAEMSGMGAFVKSMEFIKKNDVVAHLWEYGRKLVVLMNEIADSLGIAENFKAGGIECSPYYLTYDSDGKLSLPMRTLFSQEMIKNKVLIPWIALSYSHNSHDLEYTADALNKSLNVYKSALENGIENYLEGDAIKPVFRQYN